MSSQSVKIDGATKVYGDFKACDHVSLDIQKGEFFTLLGPSGCGKTTLLRMIAGFNTIDDGKIFFGERELNSIPAHLRNIGMVFQNYAIFPHLSVKDNVAYGLKARKIKGEKLESAAREAMEMMQIEMLADRMPGQLSGGQQQRVALARALVIQPDVLLMDEPLSNLDAKLRVEMRTVIKEIQKQVGITTVYVTHDQEEALAISDRIAVMHGGVIQQIGTPKHIYQRPANEFVSSFIGLSNFVDAENENGTLDFGCGYRVPMSTLRPDAGRKVCVAVRPEEFLIRSAEEPGIPATVRSSVFLGMTQHYFLTLGEEKEIEVVVPSDRSDLIPDGEKVSLQIVADKVNVFDGESRATVIREGV